MFSWKDWPDFIGKLQTEIQDKHGYTDASVIEVGRLPSWVPGYGNWHRSKEKKVASDPFTSYMMNKKWPLGEEFTNHMLRFQQVIVTVIHKFNFLKIAIPGRIFGQWRGFRRTRGRIWSRTPKYETLLFPSGTVDGRIASSNFTSCGGNHH